jgi:hypothetical protein
VGGQTYRTIYPAIIADSPFKGATKRLGGGGEARTQGRGHPLRLLRTGEHAHSGLTGCARMANDQSGSSSTMQQQQQQAVAAFLPAACL